MGNLALKRLSGVKVTSNSNVGTTTCASSRNVLTKASDDVTIKSYFEGVHELLKSKGSDAFCVNLDEVWPLVYERKDHAIRQLTKDYFEGVDYTIKTDDTFPLNGELENQSVTDGWKVRKDYFLTVSCLEHLGLGPVMSLVISLFVDILNKNKNSK